MPRDHSRRVFNQLARQGHSFSEGTLQAVQEDAAVKRSMAKRYAEVMRTGPAPPTETRPMLRPSTAERRVASLPRLAANTRYCAQQVQMQPMGTVTSANS